MEPRRKPPEEARIDNPSPCCGVSMFAEDIYLDTKRPDSTHGRKIIGHVMCCLGKWVMGDYGKKRQTHEGGSVAAGPMWPEYEHRSRLTLSVWNEMLRVHPWAPFYFVERNGALVPETATIKPTGMAKAIVKELLPYKNN